MILLYPLTKMFVNNNLYLVVFFVLWFGSFSVCRVLFWKRYWQREMFCNVRREARTSSKLKLAVFCCPLLCFRLMLLYLLYINRKISNNVATSMLQPAYCHCRRDKFWTGRGQDNPNHFFSQGK